MPSFLGVESAALRNPWGRFPDGRRLSDGMELGLLPRRPVCHTVTGPLLVNHGLGITVAASGSRFPDCWWTFGRNPRELCFVLAAFWDGPLPPPWPNG